MLQWRAVNTRVGVYCVFYRLHLSLCVSRASTRGGPAAFHPAKPQMTHVTIVFSRNSRPWYKTHSLHSPERIFNISVAFILPTQESVTLNTSLFIVIINRHYYDRICCSCCVPSVFLLILRRKDVEEIWQLDYRYFAREHFVTVETRSVCFHRSALH